MVNREASPKHPMKLGEGNWPPGKEYIPVGANPRYLGRMNRGPNGVQLDRNGRHGEALR